MVTDERNKVIILKESLTPIKGYTEVFLHINFYSRQRSGNSSIFISLFNSLMTFEKNFTVGLPIPTGYTV